VIEGSVHKAMMGHNCYGGPVSFQPTVKWFLDTIAETLKITLPNSDLWEVERVDWAECFQLEYSAISDFIHTMGLASFPRRDRQKRTYGKECVFFGGTTTAIKVYHKGPEFSSHDRKRVDKMFGRLEGHRLQLTANDIMRVETSIKAKKLHADLGDHVTVVQVTDDYLEAVHDRECQRLMKEGKSEMETVRNAHDVKRRLYDTYDGPLASSLYCTWVQLSTLGEDEVRKEMKRRTWYLHKKQLISAGISWQGTDVQIVKTSIPKGFSITRNSPWRMREESPEVVKLLEPYRMTA
jgi:II/X family phage/plasmid replication protein